MQTAPLKPVERRGAAAVLSRPAQARPQRDPRPPRPRHPARRPLRAEIPLLFEGRLPDVNVGTADGRSCAPELTARLEEVLKAQDRFTWVVNGRFKGGWTTRNYGRPAEGIHAVQFELVQAAYMDEADPWRFDAEAARPMRELLQELVGEMAGVKA